MTNEYREEKTLTEEEVRQAARYWQNKLRLNDWLIKAYVIRGEDMIDKQTEAYVLYNLNKKHADIYILHPDDATDDEPHDMEALIVHELLHLHFAPLIQDDVHHDIDPHPLETTALEQAVESLTSALITTERSRVGRFKGEEEKKVHQLAEERETYREKMLRNHEELEAVKAAERRLIGDYNSLRAEMDKLIEEHQEQAQKLDDKTEEIRRLRDERDYYQGAADAKRRHGEDRQRPIMPKAREGALDVSTHRTQILGGFSGISSMSVKSGGITATVHRGTDYDDEPTDYEQPEDGAGAE